MDELLREHVFVDLYAVVRQGVVIGDPSYSLKDVEQLYMPPPDPDVSPAGASVVEYQGGSTAASRATGGSARLGRIREYNGWTASPPAGFRDWLLGRQRERGIGFIPRSTTTRATEGERTRAPQAPEDLLPRRGKQARRAGQGGVKRRPTASAGRLDKLVGWLGAGPPPPPRGEADVVADVRRPKVGGGGRRCATTPTASPS